MKLAKDALVTVGIPTLGREDILLNTINLILAQDYKNFELIVADQTTDHDPQFIKDVRSLATQNSRLKYFLIAPQNLPAARNFIVSKANGQILIFIDDDVELKSDFISQHILAHNTHPEVAVIAGRIMQQGLPSSKFPLYFDKYALPQGTFNCPTSGDCKDLPGGNHSVELTAIKKIGGYHTAFKKDAVREESDAAHRLTKAGYKMYYSADAALTHLAAPRGGSRIHKAQFDNYRFYVNDLLFALRSVSLINLPIALFKRLRIYSGGSGLISARRFKRAGLFIAGFVTALTLQIVERGSIQAHETGNLK